MEKFSKIVDKVRLPLEINIPPYLLDHLFEGNPVLPAVEAMQILADSTHCHMPQTNITRISNARFDKFLYISPDEKHISAFNEIEVRENGWIISKLITLTRSKKTPITRAKEHVTLNFCLKEKAIEMRPFNGDTILREHQYNLPLERLYSELVPFGPAYHNVEEFLVFNKNGVIAKVFCNSFAPSSKFSLGSPFPLDAAFHAACAWGQRYSKVVAFPVGLKERHILRPTRSGKSYIAVVSVIQKNPELLIFDIWIYGMDGDPYEAVTGVQMKDVSAGRLMPPAWIMK